jgi:hypothetical protein
MILVAKGDEANGDGAALDWILDRAADSIDAPPRVARYVPRPVSRAAAAFGNWLTDKCGGQGAWTAGLNLARRGRFRAAAVAFADATRYFERTVGHDHVWTALALARQGWCQANLGHLKAAHLLYKDAADIVRRIRPDDRALITEFDALLKANPIHDPSSPPPR